MPMGAMAAELDKDKACGWARVSLGLDGDAITTVLGLEEVAHPHNEHKSKNMIVFIIIAPLFIRKRLLAYYGDIIALIKGKCKNKKQGEIFLACAPGHCLPAGSLPLAFI